MRNSVFVIKVNPNSQTEIISVFGHNNDYKDKEDGFNAALRSGKIIFQNQSNPDITGNVIVTIAIEH
jgi:hypothetical protein